MIETQARIGPASIPAQPSALRVLAGLVASVVRCAVVRRRAPFPSPFSGLVHGSAEKAYFFATPAPWVRPGEASPLALKRWSLDVFAAIDVQRFVAVCETWFAWAGFDTRTQTHRTDGGVDIWLHAPRMPGPVAIVRCKHWLNKPVGLLEMKEFLGVVANHQSAHGTYTTTSTYTPEALQFAHDNGIDAVDGPGLLRRIQTRTRQRQQALLAIAYSGQH